VIVVFIELSIADIPWKRSKWVKAILEELA
jgi:hypothetical protein